MNRNLRRACGVALGSIGLALSVSAPAGATPQDQCGLLGCLLSTGTKVVGQVVGGVTATLTGKGSSQSSPPSSPSSPPPPRSSSPSQPSAPSQPSQSSAPSRSSSGSGKGSQAGSGSAAGNSGPTSGVQPASKDTVPLPAGSAPAANGGQVRPAQPVWPAHGAARAAKAGARHGHESTIQLAAANAVHNDLTLGLGIMAMIGGVGIVLYKSHLQAPRYVGRRRQTGGPRPTVG